MSLSYYPTQYDTKQHKMKCLELLFAFPCHVACSYKTVVKIEQSFLNYCQENY